MIITTDDLNKIKDWILNNAVKDTQYPNASTFSGNEILALVQSGNSVKTTISNLVSYISSSLAEIHAFICLTYTEYRALIDAGTVNDKTIYCILEGTKVIKLYFGKIPYEQDSATKSLKSKGSWGLENGFSVSISEADTKGGIANLCGYASRVLTYSWSDGRADETTIEKVPLKWSVSINGNTVSNILGNTYTISASNDKRVFTFYYITNSSLGDNLAGTSIVTQNGTPSITLEKSFINISYTENHDSINYSTIGNVGTLTVSSDNPNCIPNIDTDNKKITWTICKNTSYLSKVYKITVTGSSISSVLTITQEAAILPALFGTINFTSIPSNLAIAIKSAISIGTITPTNIDIVEPHSGHSKVYSTKLSNSKYSCSYFLLPNIERYSSNSIVHCSDINGDETLDKSGGLKNVNGTVITISNFDYKCYAYLDNSSVYDIVFNFGMI